MDSLFTVVNIILFTVVNIFIYNSLHYYVIETRVSLCYYPLMNTRPVKFTQGHHVRIFEQDRDAMELAAKRLGLSLSEITRRCLRIGLSVLSDSQLPGAPKFKQDEQRE